MAAPCTAPGYGQQPRPARRLGDIDGVVDYIRALRSVARIHLVGWSLGGPRAAGYAAQHADKINKVVLLAPAYSPNASATAPATVPATGAAFNTQTRADFDANWDRQIGCPGQVDPQARETVWTNMLESDPVARTWGPGARRAPNTTTWGWNAAMATQLKSPTLLVSGARRAGSPPASCASTRISAPHRKSSSISPAPRTTLSGSTTTCCSSRPRASGSRRAPLTARRAES